MKKIIGIIFYGNIFYGLCTVALSIESNLQHNISLNSYRFYILIFLATIIYYGRIYYKSSVSIIDDRTRWYSVNRRIIKRTLMMLTGIAVADIVYISFINRDFLFNMPAYYWSLLAIVPLAGFMYTFKILPVKKLRRIGWLKPFIIGFVWAGVVTIFPVLFWEIRHPNEVASGLATKSLLFLQNFLFISCLAIIFDIRDEKIDKHFLLKTYPAQFGRANTIRYAVLPLALLSLLSMVVYHFYAERNYPSLIIQLIPYLFLYLLMTRFTKEKNLLFYLAGIDGLMLLKAICGIVSVIIF